MKKYIPIISTALLFASASVATAASATFTFLSDTGTAENPVNFWDAVAAESEYGAIYGNNPYDIWCNQLTINGNNKSVYLNITDNLSDNYPNPTNQVTAVNFFFNGVNMNLSGASSQINANVGGSGRGTISLANGTVLNVSNGAKVGLGTIGTVNDSTCEAFYMNTTAASVIIQGASYFYNRNTKIGNASSTEIQSVKIIGSDNSVFFRNLNFIGAEGTSAASPLGGVLEWVADANGITTINHNGGLPVFSGVLKLDFTNLLWDESWGDEKTFTLINGDSDTSALNDWVMLNGSGDFVEFIGVDGGEFTADSKHLYLTIAKDSLVVVPEPSTYAAIFGALALAFAAYRRRK